MSAQPIVPFPAAIDNTMRIAFAACQRKFWLRFMRGYIGGGQVSVHLHAGQAFARGLEVARRAFYESHLPEQDAIALGWAALIQEYGDYQPIGKPTNKTAHRMGEALVSYFDEYPMSTDSIRPFMTKEGKAAVEFNFSIPLPIPHPTTGDPIIYCGRFDMLGQANDQLWVVDEKTTTQLGDYWAKRYELSSQFIGYSWAARQYGYSVVGAIIRGIGILKYDFKHAAIPLIRPDFLIDEWLANLLVEINEMITSWKTMNQFAELNPQLAEWVSWRPNLGDACGNYGGCEYLPVCQTHPNQRTSLLNINYAIIPWDPLHFGSEAE